MTELHFAGYRYFKYPFSNSTQLAGTFYIKFLYFFQIS
jgi:hypothetical protein